MDKMLFGVLFVVVGVNLIGPISDAVTNAQATADAGTSGILGIVPIVVVVGIVGGSLAYFGLKKD